MKARKTDSIFIRCEPSLKKELQAVARAQERTVAKVVLLAVRDYLGRTRDKAVS